MVSVMGAPRGIGSWVLLLRKHAGWMVCGGLRPPIAMQASRCIFGFSSAIAGTFAFHRLQKNSAVCACVHGGPGVGGTTKTLGGPIGECFILGRGSLDVTPVIFVTCKVGGAIIAAGLLQRGPTPLRLVVSIHTLAGFCGRAYLLIAFQHAKLRPRNSFL